MNKPFAIFDMDGTLIDSMKYWSKLAEEFLAEKGISPVSPEILERIRPMTLTESSALLIREFSLPGTPESVAAEINALMERHYRDSIPLKENAASYLANLKQQGVRMCVASATDKPLMTACLQRLGAADYFEFLLSCEEVGAGKNKPDVYLAAARRFHAAPSSIAVFEDALYAAQTAKKAGFYVIGVYDDSAAKHWKELTAFADESITHW